MIAQDLAGMLLSAPMLEVVVGDAPVRGIDIIGGKVVILIRCREDKPVKVNSEDPTVPDRLATEDVTDQWPGDLTELAEDLQRRLRDDR